MKIEYNNSMVYEFLVKECQSIPELEEEFVTKLRTHTCDADFLAKFGTKNASYEARHNTRFESIFTEGI